MTQMFVTKIPQQKMTVSVSAKTNGNTSHFCNIKPHPYAVAHLAWQNEFVTEGQQLIILFRKKFIFYSCTEDTIKLG